MTDPDIADVSPADADPSGQTILPSGIRWRPLVRIPAVMSEPGCASAPPDPLVPSIALSVAEDPIADGDCTITSYVKATVTIGGWKLPSGGRKMGGHSVGVTTVWGCYGALLQLAVNPFSDAAAESDLPVTADFEPKLRDLYQGGTIEDEVLSGSSGQTTVDRASKSISSTTVGLSVTAGYGAGGSNTGAGNPSISATGSISGTRSLEQDYDFSTVSGQSSSKRNTTTSNISQMFNLLTGYHSGTNAIAVELYPRPHIAQPEYGPLSDFTPGLRAIEGIQEVIAVIVRPNNEAGRAGITLTAWLDLVHLSPLVAQPAMEAAPVSRLLPDPHHPDRPFLLVFDTQALRRNYPPPAAGAPPTPDDVAEYTQLFDIHDVLDRASAAIDMSSGDSPASPGVTMYRSFTPRHDQERIGSERYGAVSPTQIRVDVVQRPDIGVAENVPQIFKEYVVWVKDRNPPSPQHELTGNLEYRRLHLCGAYRVDGHCISPLDPPAPAGATSGQGDNRAENVGSTHLNLHLPSIDAEGAHYAGRSLVQTAKECLRTGSVGSFAAPPK